MRPLSGIGRTLVGAVIAGAALAGGCGYSTGIRAAERVRNVGITFFGNQTLERDVERPLQDALSASIRSLTDVPIADPATAEVLMRGMVIEYKRRGGIRSSDNVLLETGLYIEVEAGLYDRRSDRAIGPQQRALVWVGFVVDEPDGEATARERAIRHIADELVLDLFAAVE